MTRRVVVTGRGIVSCVGNRVEEAAAALRAGRSGLALAPDFVQAGLRSHVAGVPSREGLSPVPRKLQRFMADSALYAYHAARAAVAESGLSAAALADRRTGLVVGSGVGSSLEIAENVATARARGADRVTPFAVPRVMGNTVSANLATVFGIRGTSYSIVSACATSAHCIGHGAELIQLGKLDRVIAGGAEEVSWTAALMFDAMGALSTSYNERPQRASRPYDAGRDGFVLAGGAGILVLEDLETALARGAQPLAELIGYGASSDGTDMVAPDASGVAHAMRLALAEAKIDRVDYVNTHATSTQAGDRIEVEALRQVFGAALPRFSSTKALTGHAVAASGALDSIFCLLMMQEGFIGAAANIETLDADFADLPLVREPTPAALATVMTNSLGFGGSNASLIFRRWRRGSG